MRLELDLPEGSLVLRHILLQHIQQRLGLLWTHVYALKILDRHLIRRGLVHHAEEQKEVPEIDPDLHTIGVALAIVGGVGEVDLRRLRRHRPIRYQEWLQWNEYAPEIRHRDHPGSRR